MTLPLVAASSSFMNGMFTRLKKYSRPTHVMPATKWIQRRSIKKLVWKSCGKEISPFIKAQSSGGIYVAETVQETSGKGKEAGVTSNAGGFLAAGREKQVPPHLASEACRNDNRLEMCGLIGAEAISLRLKPKA